MNSEDYNSRNNFFFLCPDPIWRTSFFDLNQSTAKRHNEINSISSVSVSREKLHITSNHSFSLSNFNIDVYAHSFSVFQAFVLSSVESKVKWFKILFIDFDAKFSLSHDYLHLYMQVLLFANWTVLIDFYLISSHIKAAALEERDTIVWPIIFVSFSLSPPCKHDLHCSQCLTLCYLK